MIRVVSFDVGDTLLRPYPSFGDVALRCCDEAGHALPPESAARLLALSDAHFRDLRARGIRYSLEPDASRRAWLGLYAEFLRREGVPEHARAALAERIYQTFVDPATYRLFDDALPTLRAVRDRGLRVGIVSNWEDWLPRLLALLEIDRLLDFAVISGLVGHEKPDPAIYAAAIEAAAVAPDEILHVGDSLSGDVYAARAVGLRAVLLDRFDRHSAEPVPRIRGLAELLHQLGKS